jgi:hypothetical protein
MGNTPSDFPVLAQVSRECLTDRPESLPDQRELHWYPQLVDHLRASLSLISSCLNVYHIPSARIMSSALFARTTHLCHSYILSVLRAY